MINELKYFTKIMYASYYLLLITINYSTVISKLKKMAQKMKEKSERKLKKILVHNHVKLYIAKCKLHSCHV